jgi:hypothetical protein
MKGVVGHESFAILSVMQLISPTKKYEESWKKAIQEFEDEQINGFWNVPKKEIKLAAEAENIYSNINTILNEKKLEYFPSKILLVKNFKRIAISN